MEKRGKFDYILLETTGLADPGPIAGLFWLDRDLGAQVCLDGIITVIDGKYGLEKLMENQQENLVSAAVRQVGLADFIILNKTDLVTQDELKRLEDAVRNINSNAVLYPTQYSK
jgi:G3E family GTPase